MIDREEVGNEGAMVKRGLGKAANGMEDAINEIFPQHERLEVRQ